MKTVELKVARIGNSRGIRLPAECLRRYRIGETLLMEQRSDGLFLRPPGPFVEKLSWDDTARAMAVSQEDWSDWETAQADGLAPLAWEPRPARRVAESTARYPAPPGKRRRK